MILNFERGRHIASSSDWVDFVIRNNDILTCINDSPLKLTRYAEGKYRGTIFAAKLHTEQLTHQYDGKSGRLRSLADVRLPLSLGRTFSDSMHVFYAIDDNTTSLQINVEMEVSGLMCIYAVLRKKAIFKYLDRVCTDIENTARLLQDEDEKIEELLNQEQQQRIERFRNRLNARESKVFSSASLEASLSISMVNQTVLIEADAVMPDRHFLSARNEVVQDSEKYDRITDTAGVLASINNPAFAIRGQGQSPAEQIEFRQAAFEFGHNLYKDYLGGKLTELMPVLLHYENNAFLQLDIDQQMEGLPWEALNDGRDFLSTRMCFSRVLGSKSSSGRARRFNGEKLGILLVGSDSRGDLPGVACEVANIAQLLSRAGFDKIEVLEGPKATRQNVLKALNSGRFNILHFSGHSVFNTHHPYQSYLELIRCGQLYLHELDNLKTGGCEPLQLVFLNSCQSGKIALDKTTGRNLSMCRTIRESGVCNVIGMLWNISDDAAAQFASYFYKFLASTDQFHVAQAMRRTRCKVAMERAWQDGSWLAPVLYT